MVGIGADRLDEDDLEAGGDAPRADQRAPLARAVGRVVDGDVAALAEEREHVVERGEGDVEAGGLARLVARVEERVPLVAPEPRAPVRADVEHLRAVAEPREVARNLAGDERLAAGREADHHEQRAWAERWRASEPQHSGAGFALPDAALSRQSRADM